MKTIRLLLVLLQLFASTRATQWGAFSANTSHTVPLATTLNGTYQGVYLPAWDQDAFLGVPYAQAPIGDLRWRWPQSLNETFNGTRDATAYGDSCMQWGQNFTLSEDCLHLNVIRPAGVPDEPLPVLVWIYGGGLMSGSTADPRYNLSGLVKVSQDMGQPIVAVSMNYRLNLWGFFQTQQLLEEGSSNAGLLDQRLALRWVQENIASFGGNPDRVVIWGESAGAQSIAYHLFSYDGRDDGLFHGAIMESGGPTGAQVQDLDYYTVPTENLTRAVGCLDADDQLACLRSVDAQTLFDTHPSLVWNPLIDGDFLTGYPSQLIRENKFIRVPIITGANTDEGFAIKGPDTDEELFHAAFTWRYYALSAPTIRKLMELYPNDPCHEPPYDITDCSIAESRGLQWRRAMAIGADITMISGRRKMCELYTAANTPAYSYRFDQRVYGGPYWNGVGHFDNVQYSFQNISGSIGPSPEYDSHMVLARSIGQAYVRFVYELDPNPNPKYGNQEVLMPEWPVYDLENPTNMVLNATENRVEADTWRKEGIEYINSYEVARELLA